jgi:hypothetical protein
VARPQSTVHRPHETTSTKRDFFKEKQNADNITDEDVMEVLHSNELDLETASKTGKIEDLSDILEYRPQSNRPPVHGPLVK